MCYQLSPSVGNLNSYLAYGNKRQNSSSEKVDVIDKYLDVGWFVLQDALNRCELSQKSSCYYKPPMTLSLSGITQTRGHFVEVKNMEQHFLFVL